MIVLDAFYADSIPFHLATREFLQLLRTRLAPDGVVVVNVIGAATGDDSKLLRSITKTYRSAFPTVVLHPVYDGPNDRDPAAKRNVILVATDRAAPATPFLQARWREIRAGSRGAPDLSRALRDRWEREVPLDDVPVLTDDYAPTDALLME
jgi:spermidine synthase